MTHDTAKQQVTEKLWLNYFNQTLYERGVITEVERNKMAFRIENAKPLPGKKTNITEYM